MLYARVNGLLSVIDSSPSFFLLRESEPLSLPLFHNTVHGPLSHHTPASRPPRPSFEKETMMAQGPLDSKKGNTTASESYLSEVIGPLTLVSKSVTFIHRHDGIGYRSPPRLTRSSQPLNMNNPRPRHTFSPSSRSVVHCCLP